MERRQSRDINCCVRECTSTYNNTFENIKFYVFSKAVEKAAQCEEWKRWIRKTNENPDWEPEKGSRICSEHFAGNCVSELPSSPSYVPSIVKRTGSAMLPEETIPIKRGDRSMQSRLYAPKRGKSNGTVDPPLIDLESVKLFPDPNRIDKSCQIEMSANTPEYKIIYNEISTVSCMQFLRNGLCEAQTQVFIPERVIYNHTFWKKQPKDKCVGTNVTQIDQFTEYEPPNCKKKKVALPTFASIRNDQEMLEITGVTVNTFQMLLAIVPVISQKKKISKEDRLFLLLTKLKTGISFDGMSAMYHIHRNKISNNFRTLLKLSSSALRKYIQWPSRAAIRNSLPENFQQLYRDCRVMIYCMKVALNPMSQAVTDVNYGDSAKFLVGYTPSGLISFVSSCEFARTSDDNLIKNSGIIDRLEPGDVILADKLFPETERALRENGNVLKVIPPFVRNSKLTANEVDIMYQNAGVKNHYEQSIRKLKSYKIFNSVSVAIYMLIPEIFIVCCALANLRSANVLSECKDTQYPSEEDNGEDSYIADEQSW